MATATTELELSRINRDAELQPRENLNHDTVLQYTEDMVSGIEFPPVVVYHDGDLYWLSQGFHRCEAAEQAGWETIAAEIRTGSRQDALWDASGSNREHDTSGLRRTNADKRRAVQMALVAKPKLSDRDIARQVGVDPTWVGKRRRESVSVDGLQIPSVEREVTRNGTTYTMKVENIGSKGLGVIDKTVYSSVDSEEDEAEEESEDEPGELFTLTAPPIADEVKPTSRPTFNATNEMVDWARWTWNPVTGCEHNCVYCYARDIANRFYPEKFEPTFRPERLEAPRNTKVPEQARIQYQVDGSAIDRMSWRNVFVCSMADLFGRWVPDQWINDVFDSCRKSPEWNYLFLTKFPQRYVGLDFPETAWIGTSVDEQKRVANAEKAFAKINVPVKWLSVEPMREKIVFSDLSMFDWVVIGGQSRSSGAPEFHPEPWWVIDLAWKAREAGCKVYLKPNTFANQGWQVKEYPY